MSVPQIPAIIWPTPNTIVKLLGVELLGLALLSNRADDENTICAKLRDEGVLLKRLEIVNPTARLCSQCESLIRADGPR